MSIAGVIGVVSTAFFLFLAIIGLFWKLSRVVFQVEQNQKDIEGIGKKVETNLLPRAEIERMQHRDEEQEAINKQLGERLSSIEGKLDMLLNK